MELHDLGILSKEQEFPAYDSRGILGMSLAHASSNRGACHLCGYTVTSEVPGIPVKTDLLVTEGKADLVKAFQDATGCRFRRHLRVHDLRLDAGRYPTTDSGGL